MKTETDLASLDCRTAVCKRVQMIGVVCVEIIAFKFITYMLWNQFVF